MKKQICIKTIMLLFGVILFTGCNNTININDSTPGSGRIVSQTRIVDECSQVAIRYVGNLYLSQGSSQSVRVEADDNLIDEVVTRSENGVLEVGLREGSYTNATVRIYVTLKSVNSISIIGAGNVTAESPISCGDLDCVISGAGDISLKGSTRKFNCSISGAGNIKAYELNAIDCKARINGTGSCLLNVTGNLDAGISGVGNITYDGNPTVTNSTVSGIGKISKR